MSAEEVMKEHGFNFTQESIKGGYIMNVQGHVACKKAMEQFAQHKADEQSIEFAEWIDQGNAEHFDNLEQRTHNYSDLLARFKQEKQWDNAEKKSYQVLWPAKTPNPQKP